MTAIALFLHVPVEEVEIVRGPDASECMRIGIDLSPNLHGNLRPWEFRRHKTTMVMKTDASPRTFKRDIELVTIFLFEGDEFQFTGNFCGQEIAGTYNVKLRTGSFRLD
jgi:hypothetical protein